MIEAESMQFQKSDKQSIGPETIQLNSSETKYINNMMAENVSRADSIEIHQKLSA